MFTLFEVVELVVESLAVGAPDSHWQNSKNLCKCVSLAVVADASSGMFVTCPDTGQRRTSDNLGTTGKRSSRHRALVCSRNCMRQPYKTSAHQRGLLAALKDRQVHYCKSIKISSLMRYSLVHH